MDARELLRMVREGDLAGAIEMLKGHQKGFDVGKYRDQPHKMQRATRQLIKQLKGNRVEQEHTSSRYLHLPKPFRTRMCETDIEVWYKRYPNRRMSQAFIEYLECKYGLEHREVLQGAERVRYRLNG